MKPTTHHLPPPPRSLSSRKVRMGKRGRPSAPYPHPAAWRGRGGPASPRHRLRLAALVGTQLRSLHSRSRRPFEVTWLSGGGDAADPGWRLSGFTVMPWSLHPTPRGGGICFLTCSALREPWVPPPARAVCLALCCVPRLLSSVLPASQAFPGEGTCPRLEGLESQPPSCKVDRKVKRLGRASS